MRNTLGHIFNVVSCALGGSAIAHAALNFQAATLPGRFTEAAIGAAGAGLLLAGYNRLFAPKKIAAGLHWLADRIGAEPEQKTASKYSLSGMWAAASATVSQKTNRVRYAFRTAADNRKYAQKLDVIAGAINLQTLPALLKKNADLEIASEKLPNDLFIPTINQRTPDGPVNVEGRSVRLVLIHTNPEKENPVSPQHYTFRQKGFQLMVLLDQPGQKPDVLTTFNYGKTAFGYRSSGGGMSRYNTDAIFPVLQNDALKEVIAKAAYNGTDNICRTLYAPWYDSKHPRGFMPI